ncbi:MAG: hypothetical protein IPM24_28435 [Bryobacterales bacterium]|nr:hypothetical protein [Bryobacterales bacterium]
MGVSLPWQTGASFALLRQPPCSPGRSAGRVFPYYYVDNFGGGINTNDWFHNGSATIYWPNGLQGTGTLVSKAAVPDGTDEYEINTTLYPQASGGAAWFYHLHRASNNAEVQTSTGQYLLVSLQTVVGVNGCSGTLAAYRKDGGGLWLLGSTVAMCGEEMTMRSFTLNQGGTVHLIVYINDQYSLHVTTSSMPGGKPGVAVGGVWGTARMHMARLGLKDRIAPTPWAPGTCTRASSHTDRSAVDAAARRYQRHRDVELQDLRGWGGWGTPQNRSSASRTLAGRDVSAQRGADRLAPQLRRQFAHSGTTR